MTTTSIVDNRSVKKVIHIQPQKAKLLYYISPTKQFFSVHCHEATAARSARNQFLHPYPVVYNAPKLLHEVGKPFSVALICTGEEMTKLLALKDECTESLSVILEVKVESYLFLIEQIEEQGEPLEGQRSPLKTSTAIRVRERMVGDIRAGAVLPPVVIGVLSSGFDSLDLTDHQKIFELIDKTPPSSKFIIDGIQRTHALKEASNSDPVMVKNRIMRIEYWIASNLNRLIYRMLVLNTGQMPWDLRRQIEIVYKQIKDEIKSKCPSITLFDVDQHSKRRNGGEYQSKDMIEVYLAFGLRKDKINTREKIADEFSRLDFIEVTSRKNFDEIFLTTLELFGKMDRAISRFDPPDAQVEGRKKYKGGFDLFTSQPARIGFFSQIAILIMGRAGNEKSFHEQEDEFKKISASIESFIDNLKAKNDEELDQFLDLGTLDERTFKIEGSGSLGDREREYFSAAFKVFFSDLKELKSLTPCWRAY